MGCRVIVPLTDKAVIMSVMSHPVIWDETSEDGVYLESWEPDLSEAWLGAYHDDVLIGLFNLHAITSVALKIHPMILPEYRGLLAYRAAQSALRWVVDNTTFDKVNCEIPEIYPHVVRFAIHCGMVKEGINRRSFRKSGKIHHQINLGITRSEIEALP